MRLVSDIREKGLHDSEQRFAVTDAEYLRVVVVSDALDRPPIVRSSRRTEHDGANTS